MEENLQNEQDVIVKRYLRFRAARGDEIVGDADKLRRVLPEMNKFRIIRFFVALALTIAVVVTLVCVIVSYYNEVMQHLDPVTRRVDKTYLPYGEDILGAIICIAIAVVGNFILFTVIDTLLFKNSPIMKLVKAILHIVGTVLILVAVVFCVMSVASENDVYSPWLFGLCGMVFTGETITMLAYYWNERLLRGPKNSSDAYMMEHYVSHTERCGKFAIIYVALPYIAFAIGYFFSVILQYILQSVLASDLWARFAVYMLQLGICVVAFVASIVAYRLKFSAKAYSRLIAKHTGKSSGSKPQTNNSSAHSGSYSPQYTLNDDKSKSVDEDHKKGRKLLMEELREYNGLKFLPYSYEYPTYVSDVSLTVLVSSIDFSKPKIFLKGRIECKIKREELHPDDAKQKLLAMVIDNIKSRAFDIWNDLSDKYSNYKMLTENCIDCSGITISHTSV